MEENTSGSMKRLPSLAYIYLEQKLRYSVLYALQYVLDGIVAANYARLRILYPYTLEISAAILLAADICSLKESDATSTERYFGLERCSAADIKSSSILNISVCRDPHALKLV